MKTTLIISSSACLCNSNFFQPAYRMRLLCRTLGIVLAVLAVFQAGSAKAQETDPPELQDVYLQTWCESGNGTWLNNKCTVSGAATVASGYRLNIDVPQTIIITSTGTFTNETESETYNLGSIVNDGLMILNLNSILLSEGQFENNSILNIVGVMNNRVRVINKGTINISVGAALHNQSLTSNYGTINNSGRTVNNKAVIQNICLGKITGNTVEGNEPVSVSCTFALTDRLQQGIENGRIPANRAPGLLAVVNQVQALIDNGNQSAACHVVNAFIAQVNALLNTGAISPRTGGTLIEDANFLKFLLGC